MIIKHPSHPDSALIDRQAQTTVADCTLDGHPLNLTQWPQLTSDQLARIVGEQAPGGDLEDARDFNWQFVVLCVSDLAQSNEDAEAPEGGWLAAHERHLSADREASKAGSPEYEGRDAWLRETWCKNTAIYPLFVVREEGRYRIWDGYRRLAGAFYYGLENVAVVLGT